MARRSTFQVVERLTDGRFGRALRRYRSAGVSHVAIARLVEDEFELQVTGETIRRWCEALGAESGRENGGSFDSAVRAPTDDPAAASL